MYEAYRDIADSVGKSSVASIDQDVRREFSSDIKSTIGNMTNSIRTLYLQHPYGNSRHEPSSYFKEEIEKKLNNILKSLPSTEMVMELLNNGTINQHNAYELLTNDIRLIIIDNFLTLNSVLKELSDEMKYNVSACLAYDDKGRLANLVSFELSKENVNDWILKLIEIFAKENNYLPIKDAFQKLYDFELRMESFLIYKVRDNLDLIDISLNNQPPQVEGSLAEKDILEKDIIFWLDHILNKVYSSIRDEMEAFYNFPNTASWAVIKDFYDRIVYTKDIDIAWRYFYEDNIPFIWQDTYKKYQSKKGVSETLNLLINEIKKYNDKSNFIFDNLL